MHLPSSIWFLVLAVATIGYCVVLWRRSEYSAWENCLYVPTFLMGRLLWRVHFTNEAPPELQTGGVLVANHRSSVDPFFVQLAARRRVHWLVAKEYCNHFLFGPILRACQVIPTNRSGVDTASTKQAIRITREGRLVGMFPEGRLNKTAAPLLSVRSGAAVVATQASVPIIPLLIEGSPYRRTVWSPVFMPAKVRITFGTPIPTDELLVDAEAATESANTGDDSEQQLAPSDAAIMKWGEQICALAGQPDFPVELASARSRRAGNSVASKQNPSLGSSVTTPSGDSPEFFVSRDSLKIVSLFRGFAHGFLGVGESSSLAEPIGLTAEHCTSMSENIRFHI